MLGKARTNLLVHIKLPEDFRCIQQMLVFKDPATVSDCTLSLWMLSLHILLAVPSQKRQIQNKRNPVAIDEEEERQESVYGSFGDDVGVQAVAKVDRVDVVAGAKLASIQQYRSRTRRELCCLYYASFDCGVTLTIPDRCT
jgi:hypothetical protein